MDLGEKLFKLRKEKGLSQEAIAEQIGTTRQAVSKWENNQGYPETEKLLLLSNIFGVSTDYLLKSDKSTKQTNDNKGYYVSKELASGFLFNMKKVNKYLGLGFMFWALAGIPYVMFSQNTGWRLLGISICAVIGIGSIIIGMFAEEETYKILRQEPLLFDYEFLKDLLNEYQQVKKKYKLFAIICTFLFVVCLILILLTVRYMEWSEYHSLLFLGLAVGLLGFVQSIGTLESYELLVKNEQYCDRLLFKINRKIRNKIDNL